MLTGHEKKLLLSLIEDIEGELNVDEIEVIDLDAGGAGSLYFVRRGKSREQRTKWLCIREKQLVNEAGGCIWVSLSVDEDGVLFELSIR